MRRCEWIVSPPSKRRNRCLPWASTDRTARPARRSGQRSRPKRGCGVASSSGTCPSSTGPHAIGRVVDGVALGHRVTYGTAALQGTAECVDLPDMRTRLRRPSLLVKFSLPQPAGDRRPRRRDRLRAAPAHRAARAARRDAPGRRDDPRRRAVARHPLGPRRAAERAPAGPAGRRAAPGRLRRPADQPREALRPPRADPLLGRARRDRRVPPALGRSSSARSTARSSATSRKAPRRRRARATRAARSRSTSPCTSPATATRPPRCFEVYLPYEPVARRDRGGLAAALPAARHRLRAALRHAVPDRRRRLAPPPPPGAARRPHRPPEPHAAVRAHRGRDRPTPGPARSPRCC